MRHARPDYSRIQDPANLIPEDEPVLLIRGQDLLAEDMIDYYIQLAHERQVSFDVIDLVMKHRMELLDWRLDNAGRVKLPDVHVEGEPMYGPFDEGKPNWLSDEDGEEWVCVGKWSRTPENVWALAQEMADCNGTDLKETIPWILAGSWTIELGGEVGGDLYWQRNGGWPRRWEHGEWREMDPPEHPIAVTAAVPNYDK